jgi:hypothetical protein
MLPVTEDLANSEDPSESTILREFLQKSTQNTLALRNEFEFLNDSNFLDYFILMGFLL